MTPEENDRLAWLRRFDQTANGHHVKFLIELYDRRTAELLAANSAEVERRRAAEAEIERLQGIIEAVFWIGAEIPIGREQADEGHHRRHLRSRPYLRATRSRLL